MKNIPDQCVLRLHGPMGQEVEDRRNVQFYQRSGNRERTQRHRQINEEERGGWLGCDEEEEERGI